MTNQHDAMLPCPFCGNSKNIAMVNEKHDHSGGYFIACPECMASTGLRYAMGEDPRPLLVEQWNRRAATQPTKPEQQAGGVPAGFVLVPVEPTPEMLATGEAEFRSYCLRHMFGHPAVWAAMLAAAPSQSAVQPLSEAQRVPLTEPELRRVLQGTNHMVRNAMCGPMWPELEQACRAVERAHGIVTKEST